MNLLYKHSESEHDTQCDCYAGGYWIDFKLFVSNYLAHALAELRDQYNTNNGITMVFASNRDVMMGSAILHKILSNCSEGSLEYIGEEYEHYAL